MKRSLAIGLLLPLIGIDACGKGPDLVSGSSVQVAGIVQSGPGCFGCNYITDVALGSSGTYATFMNGNGGGGGSGGSPGLLSLNFSNGNLNPSAWPPSGLQGISFSGAGFDIASSGDGNLFWALTSNRQVINDGGGGGPNTESLVTIYTASEQNFATASPTTGVDLPAILQATGNSPDVMGMAADASAIYVAYAQIGNQMGNINEETPDQPNFPTVTPSGQVWSAAVARVDRATSSVQVAQGFTLVPSYAFHVLAQNTDSLFWPDYGASSGGGGPISIVQQSKAAFTSAPTSFPAIPDSSQPKLTLAGIAANDTAVAWTASQPPGNGMSEPGCQIWARLHGGATTKLYDSVAPGSSPAISCYGLALDDQYAYVPVISERTPNGTQGQVIAGEGIARVPLAGGALQIVPLQSVYWYGPRRVIVDATYVYAIDPDFVARFAKTDFSN